MVIKTCIRVVTMMFYYHGNNFFHSLFECRVSLYGFFMASNLVVAEYSFVSVYKGGGKEYYYITVQTKQTSQYL